MKIICTTLLIGYFMLYIIVLILYWKTKKNVLMKLEKAQRREVCELADDVLSQIEDNPII